MLVAGHMSSSPSVAQLILILVGPGQAQVTMRNTLDLDSRPVDHKTLLRNIVQATVTN